MSSHQTITEIVYTQVPALRFRLSVALPAAIADQLNSAARYDECSESELNKLNYSQVSGADEGRSGVTCSSLDGESTSRAATLVNDRSRRMRYIRDGTPASVALPRSDPEMNCDVTDDRKTDSDTTD